MNNYMEVEPLDRTSISCSICFDEMDLLNIARTTCGHLFCDNCLRTWIERGNNTCPTCRSEIHSFTTGDIIIHINTLRDRNVHLSSGYYLIHRRSYIFLLATLFSFATTTFVSVVTLIICYK